MGLIPAGAYQNRAFREPMISIAETVARDRQDVFFDPQTSGGLLVAVKAEQSDGLIAALKEAGVEAAAEVGEIVDDAQEKIWVV